MTRARFLRVAALLATSLLAAAAHGLPDDAAVRAILAQRIAQKQGVGFAVVLVDKAGNRLAGRYELAPNFIVTVNRDGDRIFAQATGQPGYEIFPEGELEYFYKVVDAQLSFQRGGDGKVTGVVLHQGGRNVPGRRLD